ncbi:MAG: PDZ domain-containing protein [Candidatus Binatia bacterium]|nr:PDZ domain-containing protein [Candidatus Binatia bacterium]
MPVAQPPLSSASQPLPPPTQPTPQIAPVPAVATPVYLGITGDTSPTCRYPAGVRISRVIEGSPAHQAGLKGEGTLSWKDAVMGVLAASPAALLVSPLLPSRNHERWGDLILAIDGKRVHDKEEFEREMRRFQPGDVVYFSIFRVTSGLKQIPVRLAAYPSASTAVQEASLTPSTPGS